MDSWPSTFCQRVDVDVGVGQLGGEGVARPVDKCAASTVGAHEQRSRGGQSPAGGGAPVGRGGEAGGPGVEIALEDVDQRRLDRDPAVFAALAADVDHGPVVGAANVTDVGAQQIIGAQPGQQRGQDQGAVALHPVGAPPRLRVGVEGGHRIGRQCLGQCLGEFGPADHRHGLAAISSANPPRTV